MWQKIFNEFKESEEMSFYMLVGNRQIVNMSSQKVSSWKYKGRWYQNTEMLTHMHYG